jgi:hypothetical protein
VTFNGPGIPARAKRKLSQRMRGQVSGQGFRNKNAAPIVQCC